MQVHSLTGFASYSDKQIKINTKKILFVHTSTAYLTSNVKVSVTLQKQGNATPLIPEIPALHLMEFAQLAEGSIRQITDGTTYYTMGYIDLTEAGAIALNDDNFLSIDITGAATGATIDLYVNSSQTVAQSCFEYRRQTMSSGTDKTQVMLADKEFLVLSSSGLTYTYLNYGNGFNERLTSTELLMKAYDENDLVMTSLHTGTSAQSFQVGQRDLYIIDCVNDNGIVASAEINTGGSAYTYYTVGSLAL